MFLSDPVSVLLPGSPRVIFLDLPAPPLISKSLCGCTMIWELYLPRQCFHTARSDFQVSMPLIVAQRYWNGSGSCWRFRHIAVMSALYALFHSSIIVPSERVGRVFDPLVARRPLSGITCRRAGYWNGRGSWNRAVVIIIIDSKRAGNTKSAQCQSAYSGIGRGIRNSGFNSRSATTEQFGL